MVLHKKTMNALATLIVLTFWTSVLILGSCGNEPTGPDPGRFLDEWSPCLVVHTPGGPPFEAQMAAVRRLQEVGRLDWVRMDVFMDGAGSEYHRELAANGVKIINIVPISGLEEFGWEEGFDLLTAAYPGTLWQIGNEIQTPEVNNGITISPEYYMGRLRPLVGRATRRGYSVAAASPEGITGGRRGPETLRQFIELGLLELDAAITMNIYSEEARKKYAAILDYVDMLGLLDGRTVIVTETGVGKKSEQLRHIQEFYPAINKVLQPNLICWYALYAGEGNGANLIDNIFSPPVTESPLLKALLNFPPEGVP